MNILSYSLKQIRSMSFVVLALLLICWSQLFIAVQAVAANSSSAEQTTSAFYKWYLHSLATGREPLSDDRKTVLKYVAPSLVREIEEKMRSDDGLEEDYFIKAQDYLDEWAPNVIVNKAVVRDGTALVALKLGTNGESVRRFSVTLISEGGTWKIQRVELADTTR